MKHLILFFSISIIFGIPQNTQPEFDNYQQSIPGSEEVVEMVAIKGGTFTMGSNLTSDGQPVHQVQVSSFWMAKYETTWNLYRLFMERKIDDNQPQQLDGSEVQINVDAVSGATTPYVDMSFGMGTDGYPAISMTQHAASKFCEWLSAMTGNFYRLPTEAEWEYAARAETKTTYSFGNSPDLLNEYGWFKENSGEAYHPVGKKKPNPWGLYDMHGNVSEWTLDAYAPYDSSLKTIENPWVVPTKTYPRVVRGGAWTDEANQLESSARRASDKSWKKRDPQIPKSLWWHTDAPFVGFRIVRPLETPSAQEQKKYWGSK